MIVFEMQISIVLLFPRYTGDNVPLAILGVGQFSGIQDHS